MRKKHRISFLDVQIIREERKLTLKLNLKTSTLNHLLVEATHILKVLNRLLLNLVLSTHTLTDFLGYGQVKQNYTLNYFCEKKSSKKTTTLTYT